MMKTSKYKKLSVSDIIYSLFGGVFGAIICGGFLEVFELDKSLFLHSSLFGLLVCIVVLGKIHFDKR